MTGWAGRAAGWGAPVIIAALSGCAKSLPPLPLRPEPVAWADTLPIREPEVRDEGRLLRAYGTVSSCMRPYDGRPPDSTKRHRSHACCSLPQ